MYRNCLITLWSSHVAKKNAMQNIKNKRRDILTNVTVLKDNTNILLYLKSYLNNTVIITVLEKVKKKLFMYGVILLCLKTDQHWLDLLPAPHVCPSEPAWPSACCRPSWACRCRGNNSRIVAGVAPFGSSASLCCCWLWCGLWGSTCITAASGSTSRL